MSEHGADRVGHGEASLGDARSSDPPADPEMILEDAPPKEPSDPPAPPEIREGPDDPAPNAP